MLDRPPASVAEAIEAAGLGWSVIKKPLAVDLGSNLPDVCRYRKLLGHYVTVRQDTDEELGVVGERYTIVQNHEAFAFIDQLLGSAIHFETAGSLHGGRRVWVLATLPEHVEVGGDAVRPYVLLMNSHDGSTRRGCRDDADPRGLPEHPLWRHRHKGCYPDIGIMRTRGGS